MANSISLDMQREEVRLLQNRVEGTWQLDHARAMRAWDWEYIVEKCLRFPHDLEIGWKITCREAAAGEIKDRNERGESCRAIVQAMIDVARRAHQKAAEFASATGHSIAGLDELQSLPGHLEQMREKYQFRLSLLDDDIIQEALNEADVGDYPTPGEALADLLAARQAERMAPSYAELRQWADRCPPAPAWFEEGEDRSAPQGG